MIFTCYIGDIPPSRANSDVRWWWTAKMRKNLSSRHTNRSDSTAGYTVSRIECFAGRGTVLKLC